MYASKIILVLLIIGLICLGGFIAYKFYQNSKIESDEIIPTPLYIRAIDNSTGEQLVTGFIVFSPSENKILQEGRTLKEGRLKVEVPVNSSILIASRNLENQSYYTALWRETVTTIDKETSVNLVMKYPGELYVGQHGSLRESNQIILNFQSEGEVRKLMPCVRWSPNILTVKIEEFEPSQKPTRLENKVDRCFQEITNTTQLTLNFTSINPISDEDFIRITFVDRDFRYWAYSDENEGYVFEDKDGNDIGKEDFIYILA